MSDRMAFSVRSVTVQTVDGVVVGIAEGHHPAEIVGVEAVELRVGEPFPVSGVVAPDVSEYAIKALGRIAAGPNDQPSAEPWSRAEALIALGRVEKAVAATTRGVV